MSGVREVLESGLPIEIEDGLVVPRQVRVLHEEALLWLLVTAVVDQF